VAGRGIAGRWFFVTDQRVGADLGLASPAGTARPPPAGDDGGNRHPEATEALW
jgi:hypothetical protein